MFQGVAINSLGAIPAAQESDRPEKLDGSRSISALIRALTLGNERTNFQLADIYTPRIDGGVRMNPRACGMPYWTDFRAINRPSPGSDHPYVPGNIGLEYGKVSADMRGPMYQAGLYHILKRK